MSDQSLMPDLLGIYALLQMVGESTGNYIALQQAEAKLGHLPML